MFSFPAADAAAATVARELSALADYGGALTVQGRYLTHPQEGTGPSLAQAFGLCGPDDEVIVSAGTVRPAAATVLQLVLLSAAGTVRHRIALSADVVTAGRRGGRMTLHDPVGVFTLFVLVDRTATAETVTAEHPARDRHPYEVRGTLDAFLDAERTDRLELRMNDRRIGDLAELDEAGAASILPGLRYDAQIVAALDRVQAQTGQTFTIPETLTPLEQADLLTAAMLLDGQTVSVRTDTLAVPIRADRIEDFLNAQQVGNGGELRLEDAPYTFTCGPHRFGLGRTTLSALDVMLTNAAQLQAAIGRGRTSKPATVASAGQACPSV